MGTAIQRHLILVANVMHLQFSQRVLNGEANYDRQIVTISSSDGKIIGYARPQRPNVTFLSMLGHEDL
jgi:hypothetical protein